MINKTKLIENYNKLNETEKDIVTYVIGGGIDMPTLLKVAHIENEIDDMEFEEINSYFTAYNPTHPFRKVWNKMTKGCRMEKLIYFTEYGKTYKEYANTINKMWNMSQYRGLVLTMLKAFAERDWDELCDKLDGKYDDYKAVQNDIEHTCYTIVDNLDEEDLKTIIWFCGGM